MAELNYNSSPTEVKDAVHAGKLICFKPSVPWVGEPRVFLKTVLLDGQIDAALTCGDGPRVARWEKLLADISAFVEGALINWALMKWLDPKKYEHWELRSVRPRPSLRVFGRFACPDVFVGTHVVERAPQRREAPRRRDRRRREGHADCHW